MNRYRNTRGFSICDLLIVLAAGVILVSMFLPAIQNARENARGSVCEDRLREMALAALVYEITHGRLPAELSPVGAVSIAEWTDNSPNPDSFYYNQHTSVLVQIAPFMGLGDLLEDVDPFVLDFENDITDQNTYADIADLWFGEESGASNLIVNVPEFTCPSDNINKTPTHASGENLAIYVSDPDIDDWIALVIWLGSEGDGRTTGARTNFVGCFGASTGGDNRGGDLGAYRGVIGHREVRTSNQIPDGATNTVMFGENVGTIQWRLDTGKIDRNFTQYWFMGGNVRGRGGVEWQQDPPYLTSTAASGFYAILNGNNPNYPHVDVEPDPDQGILGSSYHARHFGFGSMHPQVVNFAMLDGSVRSITRTDNWQLLYSLFGAFDGDPDFIKPLGFGN